MRDELLAQLRRARDRGQAVLFSSHVLSEVEQVCDRIGVLQRGRLVHLQRMSELHDARLVRARFRRPVPDPLPNLGGLVVKEQKDERVAWEYDGELGPLLVWLGAQNLADLRIEPVGLSPIYTRFHGGAE